MRWIIEGMDVDATRAKVLNRGILRQRGMSDNAIAAAVAGGTLERIHRDAYVVGADWTGAYPEERHLMQVIGVAARLRSSDIVFVGASAAVAHGLPLYNTWPKRVHVAAPAGDGRVHADRLVARHEVTIAAEDTMELFGIPCTTLDRTVFDLIRTLSFDAAVACADAALRRIAWDERTRTYHERAAARWKAAMRHRVDAARGARGIRQARHVIEFADGRAQLPLESVSRVRLMEIGFAAPRLQVPVPDPWGGFFSVDFGMDDAHAWGESDGKTKYHELAVVRGATPRDVFQAEKEREDWIRGTTGRPLARWGMQHIQTPTALARRLAAFHISPPR